MKTFNSGLKYIIENIRISLPKAIFCLFCVQMFPFMCHKMHASILSFDALSNVFEQLASCHSLGIRMIEKNYISIKIFKNHFFTDLPEKSP